MKKIILIIAISFLIGTFSVTAQISNKSNIYLKIDTTYTLISQRNHQKLSISLIENYLDNEYWYREYLVKVYDPTDEIIQIFSSINYGAKRKDDFQFDDINFDNYDDLMVLINDNPMNGCYEFWRFDTLSQKFIYDSSYTDLVSCNPDFNKDSRTIETSWHNGVLWDYSDYIYSYNDGKLTLIEEETQEHYKLIDSIRHEFNYRRIKKVREKDEMVIVKDVIGTLDEINEKWEK